MPGTPSPRRDPSPRPTVPPFSKHPPTTATHALPLHVPLPGGTGGVVPGAAEELARRGHLAEGSRSKCENDAVIVRLEMIVHFGKDKGGELTFREGIIFVQGLTGDVSQP